MKRILRKASRKIDRQPGPLPKAQYELSLPNYSPGMMVPLVIWCQGGGFVAPYVANAHAMCPLSNLIQDGAAVCSIDYGAWPDYTGAEQTDRVELAIEQVLKEEVPGLDWGRVTGFGQSAGGVHLLNCAMPYVDRLALWGVPICDRDFKPHIPFPYKHHGQTIESTMQIVDESHLVWEDITGFYWLDDGETGSPASDIHDGVSGTRIEKKGGTAYHYEADDPVTLISNFPYEELREVVFG